jgi:RHS repeat-associated protein
MIMPGRRYSAGGGYRYGFNGKEEDDDVKGDGNQQDYGMRIYDPRLGRFLSVDPLYQSFPWNSTYAFAENDVVRSIDLDGLEKYIVTYTYSSDGSVVSTQIKSIRAKDSKATVDLNFRRANGGGDLTKADVYVRHLNMDGTVRKVPEQKSSLSTEESSLLNKKGHVDREKYTQGQEIYYAMDDQKGLDRGAKSQLFDAARYEYFEASRFDYKSEDGYYAVLGTTAFPGGVKNGTLSTAMMPSELLNAPLNMRNAGYKKITVEINANINDVTDEQFNAFKAGIQNAGSEYKKMFSKSGVENIVVRLNITRDAGSKNGKPAINIVGE